MQNQFEINEKEIEKEIEEEKLRSANYSIIRNENYIPIKLKDFEKLKKSEFIIETPFKTKKPSNEINLIFEMLFNEILLIILSYLSPGEIILFSLTCKQAEYICSDYLLWKQIAIRFQDYFRWNSVYFDSFYSVNNYKKIELKGIQFKIQEKNQNNPKQKQIKELSKTNEKIKNYFDNSNSTIIKTGTYPYNQNFISIKSERIIYIENLENPKQEIEKKGKVIFKQLRKAKQAFIEKEKYEKKYKNSKYFCYHSNSKKNLLNEMIAAMNGIILITTLIIFNYYIDSKKSISIPKLFLLSEIDLIITIFWIIYSKLTFYSFEEYYNLLTVLFSGLIFMILISLKTSKTFNFIPWLIILLPPIILFIYFIYKLIEKIKIYPYDKSIFSVFIIGLIYLIFTILFIGLKLDGLIQIKYSKLIYLLIIIEIYVLYSNKNEFQNFIEVIFSLVFLFIILIVFWIFMLYADGNIKRLWIILIPFYLLLFTYAYLVSFVIFFSSLFKLIQKIIKNEN